MLAWLFSWAVETEPTIIYLVEETEIEVDIEITEEPEPVIIYLPTEEPEPIIIYLPAEEPEPVIVYLPAEKPEPPDNTQFWSFGLSMGTAFPRPNFVATVYGTVAPFSYVFIEAGLDAGFISERREVGFGYYSLYPYLHFAAFVPFLNYSGFYVGVGSGFNLSTYIFPEGSDGETFFAFDATLGFVFEDFVNISYTFRTNFGNMYNHKFSIGIIKRFNGPRRPTASRERGTRGRELPVRTEPQELMSESEELGMRSEELGIGDEELGMRDEELGIGDEELGIGDEELGTEDEELTTEESEEREAETEELPIESDEFTEDSEELPIESEELEAESEELTVNNEELEAESEEEGNEE
jgi:hypothetical protein